MSYQYDNLERKTATIDGTGSNPLRTISYAYDDLGRLHTVSDDVTPGTSTTYHYDVQGNLVEKDLPNGIDDVMSYNNVNQLTSLIEYAPGPWSPRRPMRRLPSMIIRFVRMARTAVCRRPSGRPAAL